MTEPKPPKCEVEGILKLLFAGAVTWSGFSFLAAWALPNNAVLLTAMIGAMGAFLTALGVKMQPGVTPPKPDTKTVTIEKTDTTTNA